MRSLLLLLLLALTVVLTAAPTAVAVEAPADSLYFTVEVDGAMKGWMSVAKAVQADGTIRYRGSASLEGPLTLNWAVVMTPDLRSYVRGNAAMTNPNMTLISESIHNPDGKPDVTIVWNGTKMNPPVEKLPAQVLWLPQASATALMPLSDLLADEDCETFTADWVATNGGQKMGLQVKGQGVTRIPRRDGDEPARTFLLTATHEEMKEPQELTLLQFLDGSFLGVLQGEARILVVGGPATGDPTRRASETLVSTTAGMLGATLTLPIREEGDSALLPAVLLVAGPASPDRDADHGGFPFFAHLSDGLAAQGVATLRYDLRSPSDGVLDFADLAADAAAALRLLADHPEVDSAKLLLLGQGEGAMLLGETAVLAAADSLRCVGMVMVGPVTTPGAELEATHPRPAEAPWHASYLTWDPRARLVDLQLPTLLLHGGLDAEVPSTQTDALKDYLGENGHYKVSKMVPPSLNHCLQKAVTGAVSEYPELEPACPELVVKRIAAHVAYCTR